MRKSISLLSFRRLFLGVAILVFLVLAPLAVFYTAGYRWNPKKRVIERNGTVILDSIPPGGAISLNGQKISERTPVTLQRVAPGTYRIRMERSGYTTWEKTLDIRSERVTFATGIRLWPLTEPSMIRSGLVRGTSLAPDGRTWAILEHDDTGDRLVITAVPQGSQGAETIFPFEVDQVPEGRVQFLWDDRSRDVVLTDDAGHSWFVSGGSDAGSLTPLPAGTYRWNGDVLIGIEDGQQFEYTPAEGRIRQTPLPEGVRDAQGDFQLIEGQNGALMVASSRTPDRRFSMPTGDWTFVEPFEDYLFFRQEIGGGSQGNWFGFQPREELQEPIYLSSRVSPLRLEQEDHRALLAYTGGELWLATLEEPPQLLLRSSDAVHGAAWHESGDYVFYALGSDVIVMELDPRGGRIQYTLASFTDIQDIAVSGAVLYVIGSRDDKEGIWSIRLE